MILPANAMSTHLKNIVPKEEPMATKSEAVSTTTKVGCRRKITFHHPTLGYAIPAPLPAKVARRNARERNRVKQVNCGFEMLRVHIPSAAKQKKMSKVDTLRHAVDYIQKLQTILKDQAIGREAEEMLASPPPDRKPKVPKKDVMNTTAAPPPLMIPKQIHQTCHPGSPNMISNQPQLPDTPPGARPPSSSYSSMSPSSSCMMPTHPGSYSAPLTPRTPTNPVQMDFLVNNPHLNSYGVMGHCNESGYESGSGSSYWQDHQALSSPRSSVSQTMTHHQFSPVHQQMQGSPDSSMYQQQSHQMHQQMYHSPDSSRYASGPSSSNFFETNSEEDELLEVIAKWEEH